MISLAINGAGGRMGQRLIALAAEDPTVKVTSATDRAGHPSLGRDAGELAGIGPIGVKLGAALPEKADVLIDFSAPAATAACLAHAVQRGIAVFIGTTGLGAAEHAAIDQAASRIAVLQAANTSLGVNLLLTLVGEVAAKLGDAYDIEIVEAHHRFKKDAPSGTALALADAILQRTARTRADLVNGREGPDALRKPREIGVHALRGGDEVGRHTISYSTLGERIEITHAATNRDTFARGALRAAAWLAPKPAGRYAMRDVLGL